jgi:hypothetical protein
LMHHKHQSCLLLDTMWANTRRFLLLHIKNHDNDMGQSRGFTVLLRFWRWTSSAP